MLDRPSQLPLAGAGSNGGIYAPTIRYHEGRFYMITTNVSGCGNFYVWTDDIHGAWSDSVFVDKDGNWWMVHLAFRQLDRWNQYHIFGREVCLTPVEWDEDGWFHAEDNALMLRATQVALPE